MQQTQKDQKNIMKHTMIKYIAIALLFFSCNDFSSKKEDYTSDSKKYHINLVNYTITESNDLNLEIQEDSFFWFNERYSILKLFMAIKKLHEGKKLNNVTVVNSKLNQTRQYSKNYLMESYALLDHFDTCKKQIIEQVLLMDQIEFLRINDILFIIEERKVKIGNKEKFVNSYTDFIYIITNIENDDIKIVMEFLFIAIYEYKYADLDKSKQILKIKEYWNKCYNK